MTSAKVSPFAPGGVVGTTTRCRPDELHTYQNNYRKGDVAAIAASLKAHGQYKPICGNVGTYTGRPREVLAGNHTLMAFRDLAAHHPDDVRWYEVAVYWVDVDDDTAARIVAVDNRTSELGANDTAALADLLSGLGTLDGTGYDSADLDDMLAALEESAVAPVPTTDDSGANASGKDMTDQIDDYAQGNLRNIVLTVDVPTFIWVQEQLETVRKDFNVESNVEAVIRLISERNDVEPPALAATNAGIQAADE